jgi:uncharacterized protein YndB with AHSA1/START domain
MSTVAKNEVTLVRILDAPREKVWRAFREAEALREWWGLPRSADMTACKIDFRVGGSLHCGIVMTGRPEIWFKWIYREIAEGERLVMEQHHSDAAGRELDSVERPASIITLVFEAMGAKTKLTVTHAGMASETYPAQMYEQGWSESLERLAGCLAGR